MAHDPASSSLVPETLPEGCQVAEHGFGFTLSNDINLEQLKNLLLYIDRFHKATIWAYGAWWNGGDFDQGERKAIIESEEHDGPGYKTIRNAGWIYARIDRCSLRCRIF